jgi:hypothetical protein
MSYSAMALLQMAPPANSRHDLSRWADQFLHAFYQEAAESITPIREMIGRLSDIDQQESAQQKFEECDGVGRLRAAPFHPEMQETYRSVQKFYPSGDTRLTTFLKSINLW